VKKLLLIEDSLVFRSLLTRRVRTELGWDVDAVSTLAEAKLALDGPENAYFAALVDLNLPDAKEGEAVSLTTTRRIPSIVFTGEFSEELRNRIWKLRIVDYALKDHNEGVNYVISLLRGLETNPGVSILAVDDSKTTRRLVAELLRVRLYDVHEAENGREALEVLREHPRINMVISDYNMPEMDGFALTRAIRRERPREEFPIIGLSAESAPGVSARFLKSGANDYLTKPFSSEEFYCRVAQNIEMMRYVTAIRRMALTDSMTGAWNRKYFFDKGLALFEGMEKGGAGLAVVMLDIDHFKTINDRFGHDVGDAVIKDLARRLGALFPAPHIAARFGGEEFCVLVREDTDRGGQGARALGQALETLREDIGTVPVRAGGRDISYTVSIGVCGGDASSLEGMIKTADDLLYRSKESGRNRISCDKFCQDFFFAV